MLTLKQQLENKLSEGFETTWIHVEDSTDYETGCINIKQALALFGTDDTYTVEGMHSTHLFAQDDELFANAAMLNVFLDENECIEFCVKYLMDYDEDGEECKLTREEAVKYVLETSGKI